MIGEELLVQRCEHCGRRWFPERLACGQCGRAELVPEPAGEGAVADAVEILRAPSDAGAGPLTIALVALDSGPRVLARVAHGTPREARVRLRDAEGAVVAEVDGPVVGDQG